MQTVVLAAGEGTRMGPLTETRPKPTLPVGEVSLVEQTLAATAAAGASSFVIVIGYRGDAVRELVGDSYQGIPVTYVTQETRVGTADAVRCARPALADDPFVVCNADCLYGAYGDTDQLARLYETVPAVGSYRVENPEQYGVFETTDDGRVTRVVEKPDDPPSQLINAGAYAFPAYAQEWLNVPVGARGERELTDVLARLCEESPVRHVQFDQWLDVGRPWELLAAMDLVSRAIPDRREGRVSEDAHLQGPVAVAPGATVRPGVVIEGPAVIGPDATVGPNAYLRGPVALRANVEVGHAVEIKHSLLCADTSVAHLSYVGDSVLGRGVNFGAGTVVANLRHDERPVELTVCGDRVSTGRRKFGVVVGDEVKTGIGTTIDAGVTLSPGTHTGVGERVTRDR